MIHHTLTPLELHVDFVGDEDSVHVHIRVQLDLRDPEGYLLEGTATERKDVVVRSAG
jgi:hypothetical protein